jgi:aspartate/glutamate racemase
MGKSQTMRSSIDSNLTAIRKLIRDAREIEEIAKTIEDEVTRKNLQRTRRHITRSIDDLLESTEKLFRAYS